MGFDLAFFSGPAFQDRRMGVLCIGGGGYVDGPMIPFLYLRTGCCSDGPSTKAWIHEWSTCECSSH